MQRLVLSRSSDRLLTPELNPAAHVWKPRVPGKLEAVDMRPEHLADSLRRDTIVLAKADWCPHCRAYVPEFQALAKKVPYSTVVVEVGDADDKAQQLFNRKYQIQGFPTVLLMRSDGAWKQASRDQLQTQADAFFGKA